MDSIVRVTPAPVTVSLSLVKPAAGKAGIAAA
jgi:hypothetical protein